MARTSLAYTEVDRTALFAADYRFWKRSKDKVGAALVINGNSGDHRRYLGAVFRSHSMYSKSRIQAITRIGASTAA
ncbi:MAG TPA: hypothetical protein VK776_02080 [Bryobacteraceae bacterium]|jgi:hypothetical protein|nr:hypothetical protein [Bryobacteraceae bacterium]